LCEPQATPAAIATIAYDVGFGDLSYFNRCFRRRYGMTPREVRGDRTVIEIAPASDRLSR
jgi:AraC-like DNA-binding protein